VDAARQRAHEVRAQQRADDADRGAQQSGRTASHAAHDEQRGEQRRRRRQRQRRRVGGEGPARPEVIDGRVEQPRATRELTERHDRDTAQHDEHAKGRRQRPRLAPRRGDEQRDERDEQRHADPDARTLAHAHDHFVRRWHERARDEQRPSAVDVSKRVRAGGIGGCGEDEAFGHLAAGNPLRDATDEPVRWRGHVQERRRDGAEAAAVRRRIHGEAEGRGDHSGGADERTRVGVQRPRPAEQRVGTNNEGTAANVVSDHALEPAREIIGAGG
jgi:hypothetical protein